MARGGSIIGLDGIILLGGIAGAIIYKDEIIDFFNDLGKGSGTGSCPSGQHKVNGVCVDNDPGGNGNGNGNGDGNNPPPPQGTVRWSSKWGGGNRSFNFSGGDCIGNKDPQDSKFYASHAGGSCKGSAGGGTCSLSGNMCRYYIMGNNYNGMIQFQFKFGGKGNMSLKLRSRHNERDCTKASAAGAFGGYGPSIHWESSNTTIACKREQLHGSPEPVIGKEKSTSKPLKAGTWYGVRATCQDAGGKKVLIRVYIDYTLNGNWVKEFEATDSPPANVFDKATFDKRSYCWIRTNAGASITLRNASISEIGPASGTTSTAYETPISASTAAYVERFRLA